MGGSPARFAAWWRWEMGRRIELNGVLRLIVAERFLKGTALILGGVALIALGAETDLHRLAEEVQTQLNLDPGRGIFHRAWAALVVRLGNASTLHRDEIAVGAILYGLLEGLEGVGLLLHRRWAEYLVVVATTAFIPIEIDELVRRPTPLKGLALLVNIAIVVYLVRRKRLFLERPGRAVAEPA